METIFSALCGRCGLSHREAADFLTVRLDTVKSWSVDRNHAPDGALVELARLYAQIERAAREAIEQIERARAGAAGAAPEIIKLALARDDAEAATLGWPCVGAQRAILGVVAARGSARGYKFAIVPISGLQVRSTVAAVVPCGPVTEVSGGREKE